MSAESDIASLEPLEINFIEEIKDLTDLPEWKIKNVYIYGSRVYGTNRVDSDFDLLVVANSLDREREIKHPKFNIHINTPDKFRDDLFNYHITNLECIFAPKFARIQEDIVYNDLLNINIKEFRTKIFNQSFTAWNKAKMKFRDKDITRGLKCVWNSIKMLLFGLQIVESGCIYDFSEGNEYWDEIKHSNKYKWDYFNTTYLPLKKDLEKILSGK